MSAWNQFFLYQADAAPPVFAALALTGGLIVLLLGWRFGRLVAVMDFSLLGVFVGSMLAISPQTRWLSAGVGAAVFGALALSMEKYCEAIAGGLVAAAGTVLVMQWLASPVLALALAVAMAFGCAVAFGIVAARQASAVTTSVQGGLLTAFGLAGCLAGSGVIWPGIRGVLEASNLALVMFLVLPIGVGMMFQLSAMENEGVTAS